MNYASTPAETVLAGLRDKERQLQEQLEKVGIAIKAVMEAFAEAPRQLILSAPEPVKTTPNRAYATMSIYEAAIDYIRLMGTPQKTQDIADAIENGGIGSQSKNLYRTVYNTLDKKAKAGKVTLRNAKWGLPEWG